MQICIILNNILILLSVRIVLLTFIHSNQILQQYRNCNVFNMIEHIKFANNHKCLQIIVDFDNQAGNCVFLLSLNGIPFQIRSVASMQSRNILAEPYVQCETFLIFSENWETAKQLLVNYKQNETTTQPRPKQFFPFSHIHFYLSERITNQTDDFIRKYLHENAIFGFLFEYVENDLTLPFQVKDLIGYDEKGTVATKIPKELLHPMVNIKMSKEENFRISLFNYPPYNFYTKDANETVINKFDGIEFRLVNEVTRNWNKELLLTDEQDYTKNSTPFHKVIYEVAKNKSDIALCAVWYLPEWHMVDLSSHYEPQCCNFFVPKPTKLNESHAMSTTFNSDVWTIFSSSFLASTILLTIIAKIEGHFFKDKSIYSNFCRSFLEAINIATSHAVEKFHKQHFPLQILLAGWILLSFWIGISYTTIYTSRLTRPSYTKPINSVAELLNQRIHLCGPHTRIPNYSMFLESSCKDYRTLAEQIIIYGEDKEYRYKLFRERKCGLAALTMKNKFLLSVSLESDPEFLSNFRLMKSCYLHRFTTFAFQKHSPYTKLFNWHIRRYQENGLVTKWLLDITPTQKWTKLIFVDYPDVSNEPKKIELKHLSGIFFLLFGGLLLAVTSFIIELVVVF